MICLSIICLILTVIVFFLAVKILLLRRAAEEIGRGFKDRLETDTNTLITISSRDKGMRRLAGEINGQLQVLREERRRFLQGDLEMKEAVVNISHDLRTPLTAVCGYLTLFKSEEMSEDARRYLQIIEERVETLKQLTEELFRYTLVSSAAETLPLEEVNLESVLEESISAYYAALMGCKITPEICICERKCTRRLNKNALLRVFGNVISNAIKYSDGDLKIELLDNGEIIFSNQARSLDEVSVSQLFNRFYTVETAGHSTGLGLSIARRLVEQMNGEIAAAYKNGRLEVHICFQSVGNV